MAAVATDTAPAPGLMPAMNESFTQRRTAGTACPAEAHVGEIMDALLMAAPDDDGPLGLAAVQDRLVRTVHRITTEQPLAAAVDAVAGIFVRVREVLAVFEGPPPAPDVARRHTVAALAATVPLTTAVCSDHAVRAMRLYAVLQCCVGHCTTATHARLFSRCLENVLRHDRHDADAVECVRHILQRALEALHIAEGHTPAVLTTAPAGPLLTALSSLTVAAAYDPRLIPGSDAAYYAACCAHLMAHAFSPDVRGAAVWALEATFRSNRCGGDTSRTALLTVALGTLRRMRRFGDMEAAGPELCSALGTAIAALYAKAPEVGGAAGQAVVGDIADSTLGMLGLAAESCSRFGPVQLLLSHDRTELLCLVCRCAQAARRRDRGVFDGRLAAAAPELARQLQRLLSVVDGDIATMRGANSTPSPLEHALRTLLLTLLSYVLEALGPSRAAELMPRLVELVALEVEAWVLGCERSMAFGLADDDKRSTDAQRSVIGGDIADSGDKVPGGGVRSIVLQGVSEADPPCCRLYTALVALARGDAGLQQALVPATMWMVRALELQLVRPVDTDAAPAALFPPPPSLGPGSASAVVTAPQPSLTEGSLLHATRESSGIAVRLSEHFTSALLAALQLGPRHMNPRQVAELARTTRTFGLSPRQTADVAEAVIAALQLCAAEGAGGVDLLLDGGRHRVLVEAGCIAVAALTRHSPLPPHWALARRFVAVVAALAQLHAVAPIAADFVRTLRCATEPGPGTAPGPGAGPESAAQIRGRPPFTFLRAEDDASSAPAPPPLLLAVVQSTALADLSALSLQFPGTEAAEHAVVLLCRAAPLAMPVVGPLLRGIVQQHLCDAADRGVRARHMLSIARYAPPEVVRAYAAAMLRAVEAAPPLPVEMALLAQLAPFADSSDAFRAAVSRVVAVVRDDTVPLTLLAATDALAGIVRCVRLPAQISAELSQLVLTKLRSAPGTPRDVEAIRDALLRLGGAVGVGHIKGDASKGPLPGDGDADADPAEVAAMEADPSLPPCRLDRAHGLAPWCGQAALAALCHHALAVRDQPRRVKVALQALGDILAATSAAVAQDHASRLVTVAVAQLRAARRRLAALRTNADADVHSVAQGAEHAVVFAATLFTSRVRRVLPRIEAVADEIAALPSRVEGHEFPALWAASARAWHALYGVAPAEVRCRVRSFVAPVLSVLRRELPPDLAITSADYDSAVAVLDLLAGIAPALGTSSVDVLDSLCAVAADTTRPNDALALEVRLKALQTAVGIVLTGVTPYTPPLSHATTVAQALARIAEAATEPTVPRAAYAGSRSVSERLLPEGPDLRKAHAVAVVAHAALHALLERCPRAAIAVPPHVRGEVARYAALLRPDRAFPFGPHPADPADARGPRIANSSGATRRLQHHSSGSLANLLQEAAGPNPSVDIAHRLCLCLAQMTPVHEVRAMQAALHASSDLSRVMLPIVALPFFASPHRTDATAAVEQILDRFRCVRDQAAGLRSLVDAALFAEHDPALSQPPTYPQGVPATPPPPPRVHTPAGARVVTDALNAPPLPFGPAPRPPELLRTAPAGRMSDLARRCSHSAAALYLAEVEFLEALRAVCNHTDLTHWIVKDGAVAPALDAPPPPHVVDPTTGVVAERSAAPPFATMRDKAAFVADAAGRLIHSYSGASSMLESARGLVPVVDAVLSALGDDTGLQLDPQVYERLGMRQRALEAYERRARTAPSQDAALADRCGVASCWLAAGRFRRCLSECLEGLDPGPASPTAALAAWDAGSYARLCDMGSFAAWALGEWDTMQRCVDRWAVSADDTQGQLQRTMRVTVLHTAKGDTAAAARSISRGWGLAGDLLASATALSMHERHRVAPWQHLSELEEVVAVAEDPSLRATLQRHWQRRLQAAIDVGDTASDTTHWQTSLAVQSLAQPAARNVEPFLKLVAVARKQQALELARSTMATVLSQCVHVDKAEHNVRRLAAPEVDPKVLLCALKCHVAFVPGGARLACVALLQHLYHRLLLAWRGVLPAPPDLMLSKCLRKLAKWEEGAYGAASELPPPARAAISSHYFHAIQFNPTYGKTWKRWAVHNYRVAVALQARGEAAFAGRPTTSVSAEEVGADSPGPRFGSAPAKSALAVTVAPYVHCALRGFIATLQLAGVTTKVENVLNVCSIIFRFGTVCSVYAALQHVPFTVPVRCWIPVVTQMVARVLDPRLRIRRIVNHVVLRLGTSVPHAVVFPLLAVRQVALATPSTTAADMQVFGRLLETLRGKDEHNAIVRDSASVATGLNYISLLHAERWAFAIGDSMQAYQADRHFDRLVRRLDTLASSTALPKLTTSAVASFLPTMRPLQAVSADLHARRFQDKFERYVAAMETAASRFRFAAVGAQRDGNRAPTAELQQGMRGVFDALRRLQEAVLDELKTVQGFDLNEVYPLLVTRRDLAVAMPGDDPLAPRTLQAFDARVHVLPSQHRPKKAAATDSAGARRLFLVKGREDLRQDERVMQLFRFVNDYLGSTARALPSLHRFAVLPLSNVAGLVGWVDGAPTLGAVLRAHRESHGIPLHIERQTAGLVTADYDHLALGQKLEVFDAVATHTSCSDLARAMRLEAPSVDSYLQRRQTYSDSVAITSIVGYVIGLGDRHPNNMLLRGGTAQLVHIDFGDCFEIAQLRPRLPEKVPFRLTRMMVAALDLSGVHGSFRGACEQVVGAMRRHRAGIVALLDSFIHDPSVAWRVQGRSDVSTPGERAAAVLRRIETKLAGTEEAVVATPALLSAADPARPDDGANPPPARCDCFSTTGCRHPADAELFGVDASSFGRPAPPHPSPQEKASAGGRAPYVSADGGFSQDQAAAAVQQWWRRRVAEARDAGSPQPHLAQVLRSVTLRAAPPDAAPGLTPAEQEQPLYHAWTQERMELVQRSAHPDGEADGCGLPEREQVSRLLHAAVAEENLAAMYSGWLAFW